MNKISKILLLLIAVPFLLHGENNTTSECAVQSQLNGAVFDKNGVIDLAKSDKTKLWTCPSLQNVKLGKDKKYPYIHKLKSINFQAGTYSCDYIYRDTGMYKQTCGFQSKLYKGFISNTKEKLEGKVLPNGDIVEGMKSKNAFNFWDFNYLNMKYPPSMGKAQSAFNKTRSKITSIAKGTKTYSAINNNSNSVKAKLQNEEGKKFDTINKDIVKIQKMSQAHLVDPYLHPNSSSVRKGHTLANFIAGVITLDPNIVKGYDPNNGKIIISNEWKNKASTVTIPSQEGGDNGLWSKIKKVFSWFGSDEVKKTSTSLYDGEIQMKIYSYAKLFEDRLWGFYYLVQERFDIGYTSLASTLLFLMTGWFTFTLGMGEAIKYHADGDRYKAEMNESGYIKTLVIIATLSLFFLSVPSGIGDREDKSGGMTSNQMEKNYTIAKTFIRKTAQYGMNTANMFQDLGLSAFIQFVVKKELIMSVDNIKDELESNAKDMYMFSPALSLREQCKKYYNNPSDAEFFGSIDNLNFPIDPNWKNTTYATNKNISGIDYNVCMKAYKIYAIAPYQIGIGVGTAKEELKGASTVLSEATYLMSYNNIAINEKMGWVSGFTVPLEYFILKNNDMFLAKSLDADAIREEAEKITGSTTKDGDDTERSGMGGALQDNVAYGVAKVMAITNQLLVYNVLPMFSDIQRSIHTYLKGIYEDKLLIYANDADGKGAMEQVSEIIDDVKSVATGFTGVGTVTSILGSALPDITSSVMWNTLITAGSYYLAVNIWKMTFTIVFTVIISLTFLITFVLYFFDLLIHFITSLFMFVWAFTQAKTQHGEGKIKEWIKNTILIVFLKPSILVFGLYTFIFLYEMTMLLYNFIFTSVTTNLMATVSLMSTANSKTGLFDSISAYTTVMSMQVMAEATVGLFGLYLAYLSLLKIPHIIFKKLGVDSDDVSTSQQMTESLSQQAQKHHDPMS